LNVPKQEDKAPDLDDDADDGPSEKHEQDAAEEERAARSFMPLEEEDERPRGADHQRETGNE
jgi:hypothetical protein